MTTYKIVRMFANSWARPVIETGLTLEEAKAHCQDPQTSSRTATAAWAVALTTKSGPWFDGFEEE